MLKDILFISARTVRKESYLDVTFPGLKYPGRKSINFYFIRVPLRKKVVKYSTPKPSSRL